MLNRQLVLIFIFDCGFSDTDYFKFGSDNRDDRGSSLTFRSWYFVNNLPFLPVNLLNSVVLKQAPLLNSIVRLASIAPVALAPVLIFLVVVLLGVSVNSNGLFLVLDLPQRDEIIHLQRLSEFEKSVVVFNLLLCSVLFRVENVLYLLELF